MSEEQEGRQTTRGDCKKFFLVGLLGAAAGAITAMLLTPWRGSEAREKLKESAQKAGEAAKEGAIKAGEAAKEGAIKAGAAAKEGATKASAAAKEGAVKAGKAVREKAGEVARRAKGEEEKEKDSKAR